jgi:hypothetical protein
MIAVAFDLLEFGASSAKALLNGQASHFHSKLATNTTTNPPL